MISKTNYAEIAEQKWASRVGYAEYSHGIRIIKENPMRCMPNTWCKLLKYRSTPCPKCPRQICTVSHLAEVHNIVVTSERTLWTQLKLFIQNAKVVKKGKVKK